MDIISIIITGVVGVASSLITMAVRARIEARTHNWSRIEWTLDHLIASDDDESRRMARRIARQVADDETVCDRDRALIDAALTDD